MTERTNGAAAAKSYDVVVVGGGAGGIAAAASLLKRRKDLSLAIVEPRETHSYQPGWTMVGGGVFGFESTQKETASLIPGGAEWVKGAVARFEPASSEVVLTDGARLSYKALIAAPGLKLDWAKVKGLKDALGRNGVTSNYKEGLSPYTWELVKGLSRGAAIFTQPLMPIKCAGAPQKAMYLSCDHWRREDRLKDIEIRFCNANPTLFGVAAYVPALMEYVKLYGIHLDFGENLVAVDGQAKIATFERKTADGAVESVNRAFDMLHVCPPQTAPDVVRDSPLAGAGGWIEVDQATLQHVRYPNVFAVGDAASTPNAKTAAAVRKQAPIAAVNLLAFLDGQPMQCAYDGYGSCPLTVERGKIVLAEFGYGGKLLPTFPLWCVDGLKPTRRAWVLKERVLPEVYWRLMLRGHEWMAAPHPAEPAKPASPAA